MQNDTSTSARYCDLRLRKTAFIYVNQFQSKRTTLVFSIDSDIQKNRYSKKFSVQFGYGAADINGAKITL